MPADQVVPSPTIRSQRIGWLSGGEVPLLLNSPLQHFIRLPSHFHRLLIYADFYKNVNGFILWQYVPLPGQYCSG